MSESSGTSEIDGYGGLSLTLAIGFVASRMLGAPAIYCNILLVLAIVVSLAGARVRVRGPADGFRPSQPSLRFPGWIPPWLTIVLLAIPAWIASGYAISEYRAFYSNSWSSFADSIQQLSAQPLSSAVRPPLLYYYERLAPRNAVPARIISLILLALISGLLPAALRCLRASRAAAIYCSLLFACAPAVTGMVLDVTLQPVLAGTLCGLLFIIYFSRSRSVFAPAPLAWITAGFLCDPAAVFFVFVAFISGRWTRAEFARRALRLAPAAALFAVPILIHWGNGGIGGGLNGTDPAGEILIKTRALFTDIYWTNLLIPMSPEFHSLAVSWYRSPIWNVLAFLWMFQMAVFKSSERLGQGIMAFLAGFSPLNFVAVTLAFFTASGGRALYARAIRALLLLLHFLPAFLACAAVSNAAFAAIAPYYLQMGFCWLIAEFCCIPSNVAALRLVRLAPFAGLFIIISIVNFADRLNAREFPLRNSDALAGSLDLYTDHKPVWVAGVPSCEPGLFNYIMRTLTTYEDLDFVDANAALQSPGGAPAGKLLFINGRERARDVTETPVENPLRRITPLYLNPLTGAPDALRVLGSIQVYHSRAGIADWLSFGGLRVRKGEKLQIHQSPALDRDSSARVAVAITLQKSDGLHLLLAKEDDSFVMEENGIVYFHAILAGERDWILGPLHVTVE